MEFVIITGMSGAGKTCVVDSLEDLGFFCIDNLPGNLIPVFAELNKTAGEYSKVAVVTDIRSGSVFGKQLHDAIDALKSMQIDFKLMFIDSKDEVLVRRFKETRRPHPFADENMSISDAVAKERNVLAEVRSMADYYFETSNLSAIQCRARIISMFSEESSDDFHLHFMSFGFKHGIPSDADFVFDLRFLPNPFYIPELKTQTGLDASVYDYVMQFDDSKEYAAKLESLLETSIPLCKKEGRTQLIVGCGCTGGHHRSVTFARVLHDYFKSKGLSVSISHRDIFK